MKTLYPHTHPFHNFYLTQGQHKIYVEEVGNRHGVPVVFLHGGPCSGAKSDHRRFFDPKRYHIILLDQRGCGRSLPFGAIAGNTTDDLIADLEAIRAKLRLDKWLLFGGSWGATLALLYASKYPDRVLGMVLRGVFLARLRDSDWFSNSGAPRLYPELYAQLSASCQEQKGADLLDKLHSGIFSPTLATRQAVAKAWNRWSGQLALVDDFIATEIVADNKAQQLVQMELHYAKNRYFISENQILNNCNLVRHLPTIIIHGNKDLLCPIEAAFSLAAQLTEAEFITLPKSGHIASDIWMIDALVAATDKMLSVVGGKG